MPYKNREDLPLSVKHVLPDHAQDIYKEAYNHAWDEYKDPQRRNNNESQEQVSHKVAWAAVKHQYVKRDDGLWHKK